MCYVRLRRGWIKWFICNFNVYNSITILAEKSFKIAEKSQKNYYRQIWQKSINFDKRRALDPCYNAYIAGL